MRGAGFLARSGNWRRVFDRATGHVRPRWGPRGSRGYIRDAVEASLRRLRTAVIDLYWYHRPDGETPIAETLEALDELVRAGTVRAIGALLARPVVSSVIAGATTPEQVRANAAAASWSPSPDDLAALEHLLAAV
jgi:aryl-alcohol dehydrogenase-like predicted oxidoreductase